MGKITKVWYEEIDQERAKIEDAGEFFYLFNLLEIDEQFHKPFIESEMRQLEIRNKLLRELKLKIPDKLIEVPKSLLTISSLKNKVILVATL